MSTGSATTPAAQASAFYGQLTGRRDEIVTAYRRATPASADLAERARAVLPGGSTRDALLRQPHAPFLVEGRGSEVVDADGRTVLDFWFNATVLLAGHSHPHIVRALERRVREGVCFFGPTSSEIDLATELCRRLPSAERVRFVSSGSEAVLLALRIARAFTGRETIAKFQGSYHGSGDDISWSVWPVRDQLGPVDEPSVVAASGGLPAPRGRTLVLPDGDVAAALRLIEEHRASLAAVIIEPLANRSGLLPPPSGLLERVRAACSRHGIVLIFDEVMAFRAGFGGAQGVLGVTPDLTTLGKIIGGGLPVGAVAGRADVMAVCEPGRSGRVSNYGTFNANPMTMTGGLAMLELLPPEAFDELAQRGDRLRRRLREVCGGLPLQVTGTGSMFKISATPEPVTDYRSTLAADTAWQELASLALYTRGFLLATQLRGCLALTTTDAHVDALVEAFADLVHVKSW